ncbi:MAG: PD-(D/E)XK nuclease family protein [Flavobacteriaceae bacterium]|nr:PD-(D/E)XK nuclease family protein [Flavobacteriaceae bacterium]
MSSLKSSFIARVVSEVLQHPNVASALFVLPSQRSCLFLKEELKKQLKTAGFLPEIISIEAYIQKMAGLRMVDSVQLVFEFYQVYLKHTPKDKVEPFESFIHWATTALHDFNEIDSYLVDPHEIFTYLSDIKRMESWLTEDEKPTVLTTKYLHFFEKLHNYYKSITAQLSEKNIGYQGLVYRTATHKLNDFMEASKGTMTYFVGFNALNKAEETIFQALLEEQLATVYWDTSTVIMNPVNEAGNFLRSFKETWPYYQQHPFNWIEDIDFSKKTLNCVGAPKNVTQLKFVGELIQKIGTPQNTALILANENLLPLTLTSLPASVGKVNITMGFPLHQIGLSSLFDLFFKMQLNVDKFQKQAFYYKDVLALLNHPYIKKLVSHLNCETQVALLEKEMVLQNVVFLSPAVIKKTLKGVAAHFLHFFEICTDISVLLDRQISLLEFWMLQVEGLDREFSYRFLSVFKQLKNLNTKYGYIGSVRVLQQFYRLLTQQESLSFQGKPFEGLQLMGMLETRVLDFKTVILTSTNEGVLPSGKGEQSFLPFEIKKMFGIPTYQEKDAIFSYHFYRLIQRAENVYLLYNTEPDAFGAGEKSRFITQLSYYYDNVKDHLISPTVAKLEDTVLEITKTNDVIDRLKAWAVNGVSPSALSAYLYNPIAFYQRYVLRIREAAAVEETVASNTMGTVIHETLFYLYKPYIGKFLEEDAIKKMKGMLQTVIKKQFELFFKKGELGSGKNKLIFEVSIHHITRFLNQELSLLKEGGKLKISSLEASISRSFTHPSVQFPVTIKGSVDRIDVLDGVTRIIDYKTGKVTLLDLKVPDLSLLKTDYKYAKPLQVLMYAYLHLKDKKMVDIGEMHAGIYSFKNLNAGFLAMNFTAARGKKEASISDEKMEEFSEVFAQIMAEIFDINTPFTEKTDLPF